MLNDKILLASTSPRRREIISYYCSNFQVLGLDLDEPRWSKEFRSPELYLSYCCQEKWSAALKSLPKFEEKNEKTALLVADTIVVLKAGLKGRVLGKPENSTEAYAMLNLLSDAQHRVLTGFYLGRLSSDRPPEALYQVVTTEVQFHRLSHQDIKEYVLSGQPMGKAGAYGFQDAALPFVKALRGSYLNVMGLPGAEVAKAARSLGLS